MKMLEDVCECMDFSEPGEVRRRRALLCVEGELIAALASSADAPRYFVTPGFLNGHAHWLMLGDSSLGRAVDLLENRTEEMFDCVMRNAMATARVGITSVCDKGPPGHTKPPEFLRRLKEASLSGLPIPKTFSSHWTLSSPGAFAEIFTKCVTSREQLVELLESMRRSGTELVKIIGEGDLTSDNQYPCTFSDEFFAIVKDYALKYGWRIGVHAKGRDTIDACIRHGVHSLEHALQASDTQLAELEQHGLFLGLTLEGFEGRMNFARHNPEKKLFCRAAEYETARVQDLARRLAHFHGAGSSHRNVLFSSDAGSHSTPHGSLREAYLMRAAGFSSDAVFRAATWNGYRMMGLTKRFGRVDPGYVADLIFWKRDPIALPLENWESLADEIAGVMLNGQWVDQSPC